MKVALLGSAPSSLALAPFADESWTIWGCSPGAFAHASRVDAWFELHRWEPDKPWFPAEYVKWMAGLTCPVYMIEPVAEIPTSVAYPKDAMIEAFGPRWFTSSLAWMMAAAITAIEEQRILGRSEDDEIGFWGVDMAATEEYAGQKAGCHHFIDLARDRGIKVTIPPESDLDRPYPLYGLGEASPMRIKLMARKAELEAKMGDAQGRVDRFKADWETAVREVLYFQGALEDLQYMLNTWCE